MDNFAIETIKAIIVIDRLTKSVQWQNKTLHTKGYPGNAKYNCCSIKSTSKCEFHSIKIFALWDFILFSLSFCEKRNKKYSNAEKSMRCTRWWAADKNAANWNIACAQFSIKQFIFISQKFIIQHMLKPYDFLNHTEIDSPVVQWVQCTNI